MRDSDREADSTHPQAEHTVGDAERDGDAASRDFRFLTWYLRHPFLVVLAFCALVGAAVAWRGLLGPGWADTQPTPAMPAANPLALIGLVANQLLPRTGRWQEWRKGIVAGEITLAIMCVGLIVFPAELQLSSAVVLALSATTAWLVAASASFVYLRVATDVG